MVSKDKYENDRKKIANWINIAGSSQKFLSDVEILHYNQFTKKYNIKTTSENSLKAGLRRTYNNLSKSNNPVDIGYSKDLKTAYSNRSKLPLTKTPPTKPPRAPPPIPIPKPLSNDWFYMFRNENPEFSNEKITGSPTSKAEVGYYYQINDYLSNFIKNGKYFAIKIPDLINKLAKFFNGVRYFKNSAGSAIKVILFVEDIKDREIGKTFISISDFNRNWINWLNSLSVRYQLNDGNYEIMFMDSVLKYIRVSSYMKSSKFRKEKGKRFSLRLRYL